MNAQLGWAGLLLGLTASLFAIGAIAYALFTRRHELLRLVPSYAGLVLLGAVVSFGAMERGLITRDFSLKYVAEHGSTHTPTLFNIAALWSALEGSILLWALILAGYTAAVTAKFRKRLTDPLVGWALLTMFTVCVFFFGLMLTAARPFNTLANPPLDGPGPNPLLQRQPAHGLPPADALPGLRGLHRALRLRHRRPGHRTGR